MASRHKRKLTNFINRQLFDFQMLAAVSEPKSGKGFRQTVFFAVGGFACLFI